MFDRSRCVSERSGQNSSLASHRGAQRFTNKDQRGYRGGSGHHRWPQDRSPPRKGGQIKTSCQDLAAETFFTRQALFSLTTPQIFCLNSRHFCGNAKLDYFFYFLFFIMHLLSPVINLKKCTYEILHGLQ